MDQFNLFEPDLELGRSLIPYGDMEIQGVWPRKQRTPSDVFPTNAALIGRGPNNDARWCATDKDGILLTNPGSGVTPSGPQLWDMLHVATSADCVSGAIGSFSDNIDISINMSIYQISINIFIDPTAHTTAQPFEMFFFIAQAASPVYNICSFLIADNGFTGVKPPAYQNYVETSITGRKLQPYTGGGTVPWNIACRTLPGFSANGTISYSLMYSDENT